jgi:hypothetical protein
MNKPSSDASSRLGDNGHIRSQAIVAGDSASVTRSNGEAPQKCFICGKELANGWFCRIPRDGISSILLCSPSCALRHFDAPHEPLEPNEHENIKA